MQSTNHQHFSIRTSYHKSGNISPSTPDTTVKVDLDKSWERELPRNKNYPVDHYRSSRGVLMVNATKRLISSIEMTILHSQKNDSSQHMMNRYHFSIKDDCSWRAKSSWCCNQARPQGASSPFHTTLANIIQERLSSRTITHLTWMTTRWLPNQPYPQATQNNMLRRFVLQAIGWIVSKNLHISTLKKTVHRKPIPSHLSDEQPHLGVDNHPPNPGSVYLPV